MKYTNAFIVIGDRHLALCPLKQRVSETQKKTRLINHNSFGSKIFLSRLLRKYIPTLDVLFGNKGGSGWTFTE